MPVADRLELGTEGLLDVMGLSVGDVVQAGREWRLEVMFPFHEGGVLLSFRAEGERTTFGLQLRVRDDARPAWRRTRHLDLITQISDRSAEPAILVALEGLVARLESADGPDTEVLDAPAAGDEPPPAVLLDLPASQRPEATSPFEFGRVFVLDLATDCGQRCTFCSTRRKMSPVTPAPGEDVSRLRMALEGAHSAGYDVLRLSGLDPLTHPDIVPIVEHATEVGYRHVHVYSPSWALADDDLRLRLVAALPTAYTFHVPLYGHDAASHDAVTGRAGSFDLVVAALDGLASEVGPEHLTLLTVVTRQNLATMPQLQQLLQRWEAPVQVFLPFPSTRAPDDAFFEVAASHEQMVATLAGCTPALGLSELLPCVRWRHQLATGDPSLSVGGFPPVTAPLGTLFEHADYRRVSDADGNTFTIPVRRCPHLATCALARLCPGSVYSAYAGRFGLGELQPVEDAALARHAPAVHALVRSVRSRPGS